MKKRVLSLSLALLMTLGLLPSAALAAEDESAPERGVLTYEESIAPQYEGAQAFSEGYAAVKKDGKWGYIDEENQVVIPFQYAYVWPFSEGKAIVCKETKTLADAPNYEDEYGFTTYSVYRVLEFGFIDKAGAYTPFTYEDEYFNEGTGHWEEDQVPLTWTYYSYTVNYYHYDEATGTYTSEVENTEFGSNMPEDYYLSDDTYRESLEQPEDIQDLIFHNGAAFISPNIYDSTGKRIVIHTDDGYGFEEYRVMGGLNEGLIPIQYGWEWYYAAYADATGKIVWDSADMPGTAEYGWTDDLTVGKRVFLAIGFDQGLTPVYQCTDTPNVYTDEDGHQWADSWDSTIDGLGFMDRNFNWVIQPQFDAYIYNGSYNGLRKLFGDSGLAIVRNNYGLYGAIDKQGNTVIPFEYDQLLPTSNGLMACTKDGKSGFLDAATLEVAIPLQYDQVSSFGGDLAAAVVAQGDKTFLIDRKGEPIPGGDKLDRDNYFHEYSDGSWTISNPQTYVVNNVDGKYGFGKLTYLPPLPEITEMHDWAYAEVTAAIEEELVPVYLQNLYLQDITRSEFCDLVMEAVTEVLDTEMEDLVKERSGKDLDELVQAYPFIDTTSNTVIAANALGIVGGRGGRIFDPYSPITRQEAATMLTRAAKVLNMDTTQPKASTFVERDDLPDWALEAVDYISQIGVMNGVGENSFAPLGSYTREQSYMTIYRLFKAFHDQL